MDVDFDVSAPWTVLFGPSGSGKTTILRVIAGLIRPEVANITYSVKTIFCPTKVPPSPIVYADTASGALVPPHKRRLGLAPQTTTLFPHLNVARNICFGMATYGKAVRGRGIP